MNDETIKYVLVPDEEFPSEEIADLHGVSHKECIVVDKSDIEGRVFSKLILLSSETIGMELSKIKREVSFCFIPCWYYPEDQRLTGKNFVYSILLIIMSTAANFITTVSVKLTGKGIYFKAKVKRI